MRALALALAVLLIAPAGALAATCPQTSLSDIEDEVMCLQCGVPLALSEDAPAAIRQRAFIQQQVDRCRSKEEIKTQLVAQFGDRVLAEPQDDTAWLVPAIGVAGGALLVGFAALRWRRRRGGRPGAPAPAPLAASDSARLDAELDRYDP